MSGVATAIGGAAVLGYVGSQMAAGKQADAADNATNAQQAQYNQTRSDQMPYTQAGYTALAGMQDPSFKKPFTMSDFQTDPGYNFTLSQGEQAINRAASANGGLVSGGTLKALDQFNQNTASSQYQSAYERYNNNQTNAFNRLASVAGLGQTANGQTATAGMNAANNIGQNMIGAGNAQASGIMGGANAIAGGAGQWTNYNMMNKYMDKFGQQAPPQQQIPGGVGSMGSAPAYSGGGSGGYLGIPVLE